MEQLDAITLYRGIEAALASLGLIALLIRSATPPSIHKLSSNPTDDVPSLSSVAGALEQEDVLDGFPIPSDAKFWRKTFLRKIVLASLHVASIVAHLHNMAVACSSYACDKKEILGRVTSPFSSTLLLCIVVLSIVRDQKRHSSCVLYLSALLTAQLVFFVFLALYRSEALSDQHYIRDSLREIDLGISFVSWIIIVTTKMGPVLHLPEEKIYDNKTLALCQSFPYANVGQEDGVSPLGIVFFSYSNQVFMLGLSTAQITFDQLPILPARLRARLNFAEITDVVERDKGPFSGKGFRLAYRLLKTNFGYFLALQAICMITTFGYYAPIYFIQEFLAYLEREPQTKNNSLGWFYVAGVLVGYTLLILANGQMNAVSGQSLRTKMWLQLHTLLYAKTLVRKDVSTKSSSSSEDGDTISFSGKAEVMNLMTTDVKRVAESTRLSFSITESLLGIATGGYMLYNLLGTSALVGLGIGIALIPLNQFAAKIIVTLQESVMKARDERASLTNELLGAIRTIKLMAWERGFQKRTLAVRARELKIQKRIFWYQNLWNTLSNSIPLLFALGSFWHFSVVREQELTPSIAFTAIVIFGEIKYPLALLPECLVSILQAFVSARRIDNYLDTPEAARPPLESTLATRGVALNSATISWGRSQADIQGTSTTRSNYSTPRIPFALRDITTSFPHGQISLVCGKIGSGKTLLLSGLLGEADVLAGHAFCPRMRHELHESWNEIEHWIVEGMCAYVPQTAWLRNQTMKENILFHAPFNAKRYTAVLEACALLPDIAVLEDGDESELGEQGINLSGGQKARVSLARALYSRASTLLLDDVLSAVDTHTAQHLWMRCFKGELMKGRTVILVSHHIQLCGPDAKHIVALDGGRLAFSGTWKSFNESSVMNSIVLSEQDSVANSAGSSLNTDNNVTEPQVQDVKDSARKETKEETRFSGHISKDVWLLYVRSAGTILYQVLLWSALILASLSRVWENGWLKIWSSDETSAQHAQFYVGVYALIVTAEIAIKMSCWIVVFEGTIRASKTLFEGLLQAVLCANIRFHDTTSRGRLLNRFGKDFYGVDTVLPDELGRMILIMLALLVSAFSISVVNGWPVALAIIIMFGVALLVAEVSYGEPSAWKTLTYRQVYGRVARDLPSTTASPLFGLYSETLSGLTVIRAFGMSTKFFKSMILATDTNMTPEYWSMGLNRWAAVRFQLATTLLTTLIAAISLVTPSIDASWAGVAFAFSTTLNLDMYWCLRRWISVEQSMVALERIKEYSALPSEGFEGVEPRPPATWPANGHIKLENVVVGYAPHLPDVLHDISFEFQPGEKVALVGRTGSGKSTLGLALLRFVEARKGTILIDGIDIKSIGLADLRKRLTIVPQDPILLSGTLRSTLDVFGEYDDADIFEALRRVNLLHSSKPAGTGPESELSAFSNLDIPVSELGSNFSTGERQLLCLARALLRRSKILIMDEATASVDYATDNIISKTITEELAGCTLITIAHRLRTVIDYDRIIVMDKGKIVETGSPYDLILDAESRFHGLCKASGAHEFAYLKALSRK